VILETPLARTHPDVKEAVLRTARVLEGLGHDVAEVKAPGGSIEEFLPLWQHTISSVPLVRWSLVQPITRWIGDAGRQLKERDMAVPVVKLRDRCVAELGDADSWLTPTAPHPPPRVGAFAGRPAREAFFEAAELGVFTAIFNLTGQPAASVPAGLTQN